MKHCTTGMLAFLLVAMVCHPQDALARGKSLHHAAFLKHHDDQLKAKRSRDR